MCADVEGGVVKYFFLNQLLLLFLTQLSFQKMEGRVGLFELDWSLLSLLLLKNRTQVTIFTVVFTSVHFGFFINIIIKWWASSREYSNSSGSTCLIKITSYSIYPDIFHFPLSHAQWLLESKSHPQILVYPHLLLLRLLHPPNRHQRVIIWIFSNLVIVIDIAALVALNYNNFQYAEILYDGFVSPFFKSNQDTLQKYIG